MIVVTRSIGAGRLGAHAFIYDHGRIVDNMHPDPMTPRGTDPVGWANQLAYDSIGVRLFRVIDMNHQTAEDRHVIEVLKTTVR